MLKLIVRRLFYSLITLLIIAVVVFVAVELLPGDTATAYLGRESTPQRLASLRAELGLDRPATERFARWFGSALGGDFGRSLARDEPVVDVIRFRLRNSLLLGISAALIGIPLALGLGIIAGLRRDRASDLWISTGALIAMTLPEFVTATFLILVFSISLQLFPAVTVVPANAPIVDLLPNLVLPIVTLTVIMVAHILRMVRTSVLDVMTSHCVHIATLSVVP